MSETPTWIKDAFASHREPFWWLDDALPLAEGPAVIEALTAGLLVLAKRAGIDEDRMPELLNAATLQAFTGSGYLAERADLEIPESLALITEVFDRVLDEAGA